MEALTIEKLWMKSGKKKNLRVRFRDWSYRIKYFSIEGYNPEKSRIIGRLDNGEVMSFCVRSEGWTLYHPGLEEFARAV